MKIQLKNRDFEYPGLDGLTNCLVRDRFKG